MTDLQFILLCLSPVVLYILAHVSKLLWSRYSPTAREFYRNFEGTAIIDEVIIEDYVDITTVTKNRYKMPKDKYDEYQDFFFPEHSLKVRKSAVESEKRIREGSAWLYIGDVSLSIETTCHRLSSQTFFKVCKDSIYKLDEKLGIRKITGRIDGNMIHIRIHIEDPECFDFTMKIKKMEEY